MMDLLFITLKTIEYKIEKIFTIKGDYFPFLNLFFSRLLSNLD